MSKGMNSAPSHRLSRADWLTAGFAALAELGPPSLKAEPLARRLGTTKGSFYWHFSDVPDFHRALLESWENRADAALADALAQEDGAVAQLRRLAELIADGGMADSAAPRIEPAIRGWALSSDLAAQSLARTDARRLERIQALLEQTGIGNPDWARIVQAAGIGMVQAQDRSDPNAGSRAMGSLVDLLLALR